MTPLRLTVRGHYNSCSLSLPLSDRRDRNFIFFLWKGRLQNKQKRIRSVISVLMQGCSCCTRIQIGNLPGRPSVTSAIFSCTCDWGQTGFTVGLTPVFLPFSFSSLISSFCFIPFGFLHIYPEFCHCCFSVDTVSDLNGHCHFLCCSNLSSAYFEGGPHSIKGPQRPSQNR